jgi:hypothetical protein
VLDCLFANLFKICQNDVSPYLKVVILEGELSKLRDVPDKDRNTIVQAFELGLNLCLGASSNDLGRRICALEL